MDGKKSTRNFTTTNKQIKSTRNPPEPQLSTFGDYVHTFHEDIPYEIGSTSQMIGNKKGLPTNSDEYIKLTVAILNHVPYDFSN